jgi:hypothetical protein
MIRQKSPIWRDVHRGTPSGNSPGYYVMNDGETAPVNYYGDTLLQENGFPLLQENGSPIWT